MKRKIRLSALTSLLVLIGLILSISAQAQQRNQQGPPPIPNKQEIEEMVSDLSTSLSLSEDQEEQISQLYTKHFEEVKAKMENGRPEREEMENLKSDFEKEVKKVLNDEQKKKFDAFIKKNQRQKGPKH